MKLIIALLIGICQILFNNAKEFTIEAEEITRGLESTVRYQASGQRSLPFYTGDVLRLNFCLRKNTTVALTDVRFSNDGDKDEVSVVLNHDTLGSFSSSSNSDFGRNWNIFNGSGQIGPVQHLWPGRHVLKLNVIYTDKYGIEIDVIKFRVSDDGLSDDFFHCTAHCDPAIRYSTTIARDDAPSVKLVQKSFKTSCAETRNINYHMYHGSVSVYSFTATPPRYRTLLNDHGKDTTGCKPVSNVIWEFQNFRVLPEERARATANAQMTFIGDNIARYTTVTFLFSIDEALTRMSDVDVGSILTIKFHNSAKYSPFSVVLEHSSRTGRQRNVHPDAKESDLMSWKVPDFTWVPGDKNYVNVTVMTPPGTNAEVASMKLERRSKRLDQTFTIFEDSITKITGTVEDQWWRAPYGMIATRVDTQETWSNVTRITVSKTIGFTDGFNDIFQLHQDGLVNLNAMVPFGVRYVPFGSSVVLGQFNSSERRPYAPISTVLVDPYSLQFHLGYDDTSVTQLDVNSKGEATQLQVKLISVVKDRSVYPFAAVRSTWVSDGNADIDHVSANLNDPKEALNGWDRLYGTAFAFFRQCISLHNTQGPDLFFELLKAMSDSRR